MPDTAITSALGYAGVFLLVAGVFLVLAGLNILRLEKITVTPGRKTWGVGTLLAVLGIAFLLPEVVELLSPASTSVSTVTTATAAASTTLERINTDTPTPALSETALPIFTNTPVPAPTVTPSPVPTPGTTSTQLLTPTTFAPEPQQVKWGPVDKLAPGICVNDCTEFIPWAQLQVEVERNLLPQVSNVPAGSTVTVGDWQGEKDFVVQIAEPNGRIVGHVWFGPDPYLEWEFDGLVRVGYPSIPAVVWDTLQRYSDGSYHRQ